MLCFAIVVLMIVAGFKLERVSSKSRLQKVTVVYNNNPNNPNNPNDPNNPNNPNNPYIRLTK